MHLTPRGSSFAQEHKAHLLGLFEWLVPVSLRFIRRDLKEAAPTLDGQLVNGLMRNFTAMTPHFQVLAGGDVCGRTLEHSSGQGILRQSHHDFGMKP